MDHSNSEKQNLTIKINRDILRKARILAARRSTSIGRLLSEQIEQLFWQDEWERAERTAVALLEKGFPLGGHAAATRDDLHER